MDEPKRPVRGMAAPAGLLLGLAAWLVFLDSYVSNRDGHLHVPALAKPILAVASFLLVTVSWNVVQTMRERRNR